MCMDRPVAFLVWLPSWWELNAECQCDCFDLQLSNLSVMAKFSGRRICPQDPNYQNVAVFGGQLWLCGEIANLP